MYRLSVVAAGLLAASAFIDTAWAAANPAGGAAGGQKSLTETVTAACASSATDKTISEACAGAACLAAGGASKAPKNEVGKLGALLASYVNKYGQASPDQADAIQACVAAAPKALIIAFQQGTGGDVGSVGKPRQASPE
jgi:hypothetical protein